MSAVQDMHTLMNSKDASDEVDVHESNIPRRNAISTPSHHQNVPQTRFEDLPIFLDADYQIRGRQGQDGTVSANNIHHEHTSMKSSYGHQAPAHPPLALEEAPRPPIDESNLPIQLVYTSLEAAEISSSLLHYTYNWKPPGHIPSTQQERIYWVSHLLHAMIDTSACLEKRDKGAFLKRWAPLSSGAQNPYYRLEALELTCWKLFHVAMELYTYGTQALGVYDEEALRATKQDKQLGFEERMGAICELLQTSKTRCDKLLKGEMVVMTVARPCNRMKSVKTNKVNNESRQRNIEEGKKARREKEERNRDQGAALSLPMERKRRVGTEDEDDVHVYGSTPPWKRQRER